MNQQPDKLFREKLENYHKPVSPTAWSRVEKNINKKNDRTLWLKIAASLLLVATATILLWPDELAENPLANQQKNTAKNKIETTATNNPAKGREPITMSEDKRATPQTKVSESFKRKSVAGSKKQKVKSKKQEYTNSSVRDVTITEVQMTEKKQDQLTLPQVSETTTNQSEIAVVQKTVTHDEGITLVYTAKEVDEKYLDKKALAEATSSDKKPSTLRKLLDKAYDLKHNQDPFGDLRHKKNEILALNFKNEKQRSQNK
jgi:hypothetical protein